MDRDRVKDCHCGDLVYCAVLNDGRKNKTPEVPIENSIIADKSFPMVGVVLLQALGALAWMAFVGCETFLPHYSSIMGRDLQVCFSAGRRPLFFINTPLIFSFHQLSTLTSSSLITVQAAKSGRCLNIPSIIAPTSPIITTLLMYRITIVLSMIGLNS